METFVDIDGEIGLSPMNEKPKKRSPNNRPPDWKLVAEICLRAEEQHYSCPICTSLIPGIKRNLRLHIREDHSQAECVSYLVSWSDYFDGETEQEVEVDFITGTHLKIFIPGKEIFKKLKKLGYEPTFENFQLMHNQLISELSSYMSELILDRNYDPIEEIRSEKEE